MVTGHTSPSQWEGSSFRSKQQGFWAHFQVRIRPGLKTPQTILPLLACSRSWAMSSPLHITRVNKKALGESCPRLPHQLWPSFYSKKVLNSTQLWPAVPWTYRDSPARSSRCRCRQNKCMNLKERGGERPASAQVVQQSLSGITNLPLG